MNHFILRHIAVGLLQKAIVGSGRASQDDHIISKALIHLFLYFFNENNRTHTLPHTVTKECGSAEMEQQMTYCLLL